MSVPGNPSSSPEILWLKVYYWNDISQAPTVHASPGATLLSKTTELVEAGPVMGGWYKDTWKWQFDPKPDTCVFTIVGDQDWGSQIDVVQVVPEPGSLLILCTGAAGLAGAVLRRRR